MKLFIEMFVVLKCCLENLRFYRLETSHILLIKQLEAMSNIVSEQ
jgi:hypothetical protein